MNFTHKEVSQMIRERRAISNGLISKDARKVIRNETIRGWAFITPGIIYSIIFIFIAAGVAMFLITKSGSLDRLRESSRNNLAFIFENEHIKQQLWQATKVSFKFTFFVSLIGIGTAVIIVAILNTANIKGRTTYMSLLFLPQVTSIVASALIFTRIFGINGPFGWDLIHETSKVLTVTIILYIWLQISSSVVIYNTAFTAIDKTQYENAKIEGSGPIRTFFRITIPNLSNILMYSLFTSFVGGLAVFDAPFVIAQYVGGDTTQYTTIAYLGYSYLIGSASIVENVGVGMAILTVLSVILFMVTLLVNKIQPITKKRV